MFAYRHGFHAGNRADVFKHSILTAALLRFRAKEKPFLYFDTHAGAGWYRLDSPWSVQTGEAAAGVSVLLASVFPERRRPEKNPEGAPPVPKPLAIYASLCVKSSRGDSAGVYPGSPAISALLSRPGDSLVLCELHPNEINILRHNMKKETLSHIFAPEGLESFSEARYTEVEVYEGGAESFAPSGVFRSDIHIHHRDGFEALSGLLPPVGKLPKRGIVLVDPSYEMPRDYQAVAEAVPAAVAKWNTGVFFIWYPLIERRRPLVDKMKKQLAGKLSAYFSSPSLKGGSVSVEKNAGSGAHCGRSCGEFFFSEMEFAGREGGGMYGCGMLVVRPPWRFAAEVSEINAYLTRVFRLKQ